MIPPAFATLSDRYRVKAELGTGGMATVYLADDVKHRRQVAIKVLKPEISAVIGRERFLREIEIAARLNHPHIVPLFDSGAVGDLLYYVMPYIPGESLRARLQREAQLPLDDALRLTREIAAALGHAHQQDLVHRDIKPENILIVDGMALVADFGIARTIGAHPADQGTQVATMVGAVIGTPQYMSPEQATGGAVDQRSDIYSLACVLFEMLAGHPPFVAATADSLLRMHVTAEPRPVTESRPAIPSAVARIVARGLAKLPDDRFASTAQFAEAIAAATTDATAAAAPPASVATAHHLPRPRTQFIGREREIAECARLLEDTRLLTLTGIGGSGKTRLAIRVAEETVSSHPDGVWFVDLAPVTDAARVLEAIAGVFGVRESADTDLRTSVRDHLSGRRLLLILDNCEHLLAAVAGRVDEFLEAAAGLRVLVTSREGLGVDGERLFAVRSLPAPPVDARDPGTIAASHAVQLFMDRAQRLAPDFELTDGNAAAVADICRRLDGIPLALELAAARVKLLSVEQIRSRLDDRFRLLTGGKNALPRQQTLQAAIQWSYDQLTADEQRLLRVLSVFVGGWTLEIATRVFEDDGDEFAVLDLLSRLVDKSLVLVTRGADGDTRYTLLETVRQYAAGRLIDSGAAAIVRRRHADAFLAIAERAYVERVTKEARWAELLDTEHDNVRAALVVSSRQRPREVPGVGWSAGLVLARALVPARGTRAPHAGAHGVANDAGAQDLRAGAVGRRLSARAARRQCNLDADDGGGPADVARGRRDRRGRRGARRASGGHSSSPETTIRRTPASKRASVCSAKPAIRTSSIARRSRWARCWWRSDESRRRGRSPRKSSRSHMITATCAPSTPAGITRQIARCWKTTTRMRSVCTRPA